MLELPKNLTDHEPSITDGNHPFLETNKTLSTVFLGGTGVRKLYRFFETHKDEEFSNKQLHSYFDLSPNTINRYLARLRDRGYIMNPIRGFWTLAPLKVNLDILSETRYDDLTIHGISLKPGCLFDPLGSNCVNIKMFWDDDRKSYIPPIPKNTPISHVNIYISLNGCIQIACTENPLTVSDFMILITYLKTIFKNFESYEWIVTQIGLNKDYKHILLEGLNSMTYSSVESQLVRIYNKKDIGMRREVHLNGHFPLDSAIDLLNNSTTRDGLDTDILYKRQRKNEDAIHEISNTLAQLNKTTQALMNKISPIE